MFDYTITSSSQIYFYLRFIKHTNSNLVKIICTKYNIEHVYKTCAVFQCYILVTTIYTRMENICDAFRIWASSDVAIRDRMSDDE